MIKKKHDANTYIHMLRSSEKYGETPRLQTGTLYYSMDTM